MEIFSLLSELGHEQVVFCHEPSCGYKGIIAIHDTTLGPSLGGTRFWNYASDEEALIDALRLSRGMTYKAAVAGLNLGGGKSVIIGDPRTTRREMIFRAHGRFIESLAGRYITAEDVGTSVSDMDFVAMETSFVSGLPGKSGDPSPVTAYGTYQGIKAAALEKYGSDSLSGKTVAVQGVGHVGYYLCAHLASEGARLIVTDIDQERVQRIIDEFGATAETSFIGIAGTPSTATLGGMGSAGSCASSVSGTRINQPAQNERPIDAPQVTENEADRDYSANFLGAWSV